MKYDINGFPAHLTLVGELNGRCAYEASGRRIKPYPPFVTAPQTVAVHGRLVIEPHYTDIVVYPELFFILGNDIGIGEGGEKDVLGYGISLGMYQNSLVEEAKAKGGTPRDLTCCHWYQLQSDGTHAVGRELIDKLDVDECRLTLCLGDRQKVYDMEDMIWQPDKFLSEMSLLAHFRKNDMVFLGPVNAPMELKGETRADIKSDIFGDFNIEIVYK